MSERVVFKEEFAPLHYVTMFVSGEMDSALLDALEAYVGRQRRRLEYPTPAQSVQCSQPTNPKG